MSEASPKHAAVPTGALPVALITAFTYAAVGAMALLLAGPPGYASPLYPSAGIALAAALVWRRAALVGVLFGSALVNGMLAWLQGNTGAGLWLLPWLIAVGAMLQAWLGAALIERHVESPPALRTGRDTAVAGALGAGVACVVSASVGTVALLALGVLPIASLAANWWTWWLGDCLGVVIGAPLTLAFIGRPRADWQPRRATLALPLLLALAVVAMSVIGLHRAEQGRADSAFQNDVERVAGTLRSRLTEPLHALHAVHGALDARDIDTESLAAKARWWLEQPMRLQAVGHSVWVAGNDIAAFEAAARAEGLSDFRVFDRDDGRARAADGGALVLRHIVPLEGNRTALGVNALSVPAARAAIDAARRSGQTVATAGFRLTQAEGDVTGMVLYRALYRGNPGDEAARLASFQGVVFVTLSAGRLLDGLLDGDMAYLAACIVDPAPGVQRPRLAGAAGCERSTPVPGTLLAVHELTLADRPLQLRVTSLASTAPNARSEAAWLLATAGLASTAMLGGMLLVVTGQSRRTLIAVDAATTELRRENSERAQAEQALREGEERLRNILNHLPVGVLFSDPQGVVLDCNPRLCAMAGRDAAQVRGRSMLELIAPQDVAGVRELFRKLLDGSDTTSSTPLTLASAQGSPLRVRMVCSALRDSQGRVLRLVGLLEDITESLRLQDSERSRQRAEVASQAKSDFLSRMSHELRTPLNAIIGFAQLLDIRARNQLDAEQRQWTQQIQQAGWHLLELINETLDLSRIEAGAVQLNPKALSLDDEVRASVALVSTAASRQSVAIQVMLDPKVGGVRADSTRLKQVLTNLLGNAVKYNRPGGLVTLHARPGAEGMVELAVTDTGLGLTAEQQAALFQPYNRLGRENSGIEGTGIGLVISRRLVELMGGDLSVHSEIDRGSTFTLRLPAADLPSRPAADAAVIEPLTTVAVKRLHYIEDNATNIEIMQALIGTRAHLRLSSSASGLDGLIEIRRAPPDLILLDMGLPDISGQEVLRRLKDDDVLSTIPVIVVSADATPQQVQQALRQGACSYVTKPIAIDAFLEIVDHTLDASVTQW